jgi:hypothetical protein
MSRVTTLYNGSVAEVTSSGSRSYTDFVTKGDNHPNWRYLISHNRDATTQLVARKYYVKPARFSATIRRLKPETIYTKPTWVSSRTSTGSYFPGNNTANPLSTTKADLEARGRFVNKAYDLLTQVQGGVIAGEFAQTVRLIRRPLGGLRDGFSRYLAALKKRRQRRGPQKVVRRNNRRILSETWLEYNFGFIPLINDINDIVDTLDADHFQRVVRITGVGEDSKSNSQGVTSLTAINPPYVQGRVIKRQTVKVIYHGAVRAGLDNPFKSRNIGLNYRNFIPTAWELLPWSWAVDYFTNIGDIINGSAVSRSDMAWVCKTIIEDNITELSGIFVSPFTPAKWSNRLNFGSAGSVTKRDVSRASYNGPLAPSFRFELPGLGRRALNLGAVLRTHKRLIPYR